MLASFWINTWLSTLILITYLIIIYLNKVKKPTHLIVSNIQRIKKTFVGQVLNFQILLTYMDN
jgi:hypothetical protein